MGATFKENVEDIRNSKVADVVKEFQSYGVNVDVTDPVASSDDLLHEYGFSLTSNLSNDYDAIVITVGHQQYTALDESWFRNHLNGEGLVVDLKGIFKSKLSSLNYWSL